VLQCRSVFQYVAVCCNVLQCVAVCCCVLQCVAMLVIEGSKVEMPKSDVLKKILDVYNTRNFDHDFACRILCLCTARNFDHEFDFALLVISTKTLCAEFAVIGAHLCTSTQSILFQIHIYVYVYINGMSALLVKLITTSRAEFDVIGARHNSFFQMMYFLSKSSFSSEFCSLGAQ